MATTPPAPTITTTTQQDENTFAEPETPTKSNVFNIKNIMTIDVPQQHLAHAAEEDHFIYLPYQVDPISHFALDIGGSLVKMVYYSSEDLPTITSHNNPPKSPIHISQQEKAAAAAKKSTGGRICFARFRTANIDECFDFVKDYRKECTSCNFVHVTGGGAYKFSTTIQEQLPDIKIKKYDEMECLIKGLNFLLKNLNDETFIYNQDHTKKYLAVQSADLYPYMLVNIGSGVSIVKVIGETKYERVSGSSLGGGTFWGLCSLLTQCTDFEEMLTMTKQGDNRNVDMLVGDIYGRGYEKIGLGSDIIASSMAKPVMKLKTDEDAKTSGTQFSNADIAKSLLFMICNNIGQIAYLNAKLHNLKRIYFAGYFIRDHPITMRTISYAINFWSKGEMQAYFLKHEGYLGALGTFLATDDDVKQDTNV